MIKIAYTFKGLLCDRTLLKLNIVITSKSVERKMRKKRLCIDSAYVNIIKSQYSIEFFRLRLVIFYSERHEWSMYGMFFRAIGPRAVIFH